MKIDCISDLHGHFPELQGGDVLIVAGDLTATDSIHDHDLFFDWLSIQNYKYKIYAAGNHDNLISTGKCSTPKHFDSTYLCDSGSAFEGLKMWGTPWTKTFPGMNPKCKAFTCDTEEQLAEKFALIPNDIDILISHGPPYGILDEVQDYESGKVINTGSMALRDALDRVKPEYLIFGHIHEHGGKSLVYKHQGPNTLCVNASYVNEKYKPVNMPVRIGL